MSVKTNVQQFLRSAKTRPSQTCATCSLPKPIQEAIDAYAEERKAGSTRVSAQQFYDEFLKKEMRYPLTVFAFRRHLKECKGVK